MGGGGKGGSKVNLKRDAKCSSGLILSKHARVSQIEIDDSLDAETMNSITHLRVVSCPNPSHMYIKRV